MAPTSVSINSAKLKVAAELETGYVTTFFCGSDKIRYLKIAAFQPTVPEVSTFGCFSSHSEHHIYIYKPSSDIHSHT